AVRSLFVYLPGLEILRHRLSERASSGSDDVLVTAQVLEAYVRWLDETIVAGVEARRAGWRIVLIADPGRGAGAATAGFVGGAGGREGLGGGGGDGAAGGWGGPAIGDLDVAPLVLRVMDLPSSAEMSGRAPTRCFEAAPTAPPRIATWGRRGLPTGSTASDYD